MPYRKSPIVMLRCCDSFSKSRTRTTTTASRSAQLLLPMVVLALAGTCCEAVDLARFYGYGHVPGLAIKRADGRKCRPTEPFLCPGGETCISIAYLCDGAPDCPDSYDEDSRLCTAARRPPVEETASFLRSLLASHGPNYLEKMFGPKARDALLPLGGVEAVAIALSESQTIEDFGLALNLMFNDVEHLRSVFLAVENGDMGTLKALGIKDSELGDVKFFLDKLLKTGFLD